MHSTPASLLERLRLRDDQAAWERFVQLYTPLLCHWGQRLGLKGPDLDDLVQDVFAILVRELPEFHYDPRKTFRGWLWTVTVNKVRQRKRQPAAGRQAAEGLLEELPDRDNGEAVAEAEYRDLLVQQALQLLRAEFQPSTWQAFWQCGVVGRPAAEVAAELGLSLDAVYAAKSRVLRRLRRELDGLLN
jgi:RNA polymerase sigma-70 factor (ECF subfamily)